MMIIETLLQLAPQTLSLNSIINSNGSNESHYTISISRTELGNEARLNTSVSANVQPVHQIDLCNTKSKLCMGSNKFVNSIIAAAPVIPMKEQPFPVVATAAMTTEPITNDPPSLLLSLVASTNKNRKRRRNCNPLTINKKFYYYWVGEESDVIEPTAKYIISRLKGIEENSVSIWMKDGRRMMRSSKPIPEYNLLPSSYVLYVDGFVLGSVINVYGDLTNQPFKSNYNLPELKMFKPKIKEYEQNECMIFPELHMRINYAKLVLNFSNYILDLMTPIMYFDQDNAFPLLKASTENFGTKSIREKVDILNSYLDITLRYLYKIVYNHWCDFLLHDCDKNFNHQNRNVFISPLNLYVSPNKSCRNLLPHALFTGKKVFYSFVVEDYFIGENLNADITQLANKFYSEIISLLNGLEGFHKVKNIYYDVEPFYKNKDAISLQSSSSSCLAIPNVPLNNVPLIDMNRMQQVLLKTQSANNVDNVSSLPVISNEIHQSNKLNLWKMSPLKPPINSWLQLEKICKYTFSLFMYITSECGYFLHLENKYVRLFSNPHSYENAKYNLYIGHSIMTYVPKK